MVRNAADELVGDIYEDPGNQSNRSRADDSSPGHPAFSTIALNIVEQARHSSSVISQCLLNSILLYELIYIFKKLK